MARGTKTELRSVRCRTGAVDHYVTMLLSIRWGEEMLLLNYAKFKDSRFDVRTLTIETACQISLRS